MKHSLPSWSRETRSRCEMTTSPTADNPGKKGSSAVPVGGLIMIVRAQRRLLRGFLAVEGQVPSQERTALRAVRVWRSVLGVAHTVIEKVELESVGGEEVLVATVRPTRSRQGRCGRCDRRAPRYDNGEGPLRWRSLDAGTTWVYLQAEAPRVSCPVHGVVVAAVPWARHDSRFTSTFEDTAAWLACHAAFTVLAALLRITWRSVAAVITRVVAERAGQTDRLTGLRRIGVDEISYRKGHRYLLCVVDHDTGRLVWAAKGRDSATLRRFFDALGEYRSALLTHISADGAEWIHTVATERAPQAMLCLDAFHVVAWATVALDAVRRHLEPTAPRRQDRPGQSTEKQPVGIAEKPTGPHR
jgi:transposase